MNAIYTKTHHKTVMKLRAKGLPYREISEKTGISPQTVAHWIRTEILKHPSRSKALKPTVFRTRKTR